MTTTTTDTTPTEVTLLRPETANLPVIVENRPLVALAEADEARSQEIKALISEATLADTNSIVTFGAAANSELTKISEQILGNARNKEFGAAGGLINSLVLEIRGFDPKAVGQDIGWWDKLVRKVTPLARMVQRYEQVQGQLTVITNQLDEHKTELMKHIALQDRMEAATHKALDRIEAYIAAGDALLEDWSTKDLAEAKAAAEADSDPRAAQKVTDITNQIRLMERTVHGLRMTRQVTLQSIPRIDLLQDNDTNLVTKIDSLITHALPMWKQQLAQALMIEQMAAAAGAVKAATDLTNDLLVQNAEDMQKANKEVRTEIERSTFDIEAVEKANNLLIQTLNETTEIYEAGAKARAEAETRLDEAENALKDAMLEADKQAGAA